MQDLKFTLSRMVLDDVTVVVEDVTFVLHALAALQTNVTKEMEHVL